MNHLYWIYVGDGGSQATIGIYHQPQRGQVLIYCDKRPIEIAFKVFDDRDFTFFLEEELCRIRLHKRPDGSFEYEFGIVTDVATPLNLARKAEERRTRWQSAALFVGVLLAVGATVGLGHWAYRHQLARELARQGVVVEGSISIQTLPKSYYVRYHYPVGSTHATRNIEYYRDPNPIAPNGLPLYDGDAFYVKYARFNPANSKLYFDQPTGNQLQRYYRRVALRQAAVHADFSAAQCRCVAEAAYAVFGLQGLAALYFEGDTAAKSYRRQRIFLQKMEKNKRFQQAVAACFSAN